MKKLIVDPVRYFDNIRMNKNIVMYGAGQKAGQIVKLLEEQNIYPCEVCDSDKKLQGQEFMGKYVIQSYETIKEKYESYCILITTTINIAVNIREMLLKKGEKNPIFHVCNFFKVDEEF